MCSQAYQSLWHTLDNFENYFGILMTYNYILGDTVVDSILYSKVHKAHSYYL